MSSSLARLLAAVVVPTLVAVAAAQPAQKPLTVEAIYAHGPLIGSLPEGLTWSPDGKHLTYLDSGQLIDLDPGNGRSHVLVSQAKLAPLMREDASERDRDHRQRYKMAGYQWAPDGTHLLFDTDGRLWIYDLKSSTGIELGYTGAASGDDPKFSPDGKQVSYLRDNAICVAHLRDPGAPVSVATMAPNAGTLEGKVDWVYEEELDVRSNYFWSPDSNRIAYLQMNEASVPQYPIEDWIPPHASVYEQHYPQPGDSNPEVRVGVASASGSRTVWMRVPIEAGQDYIPRFGWADKHTLWIETLSRDQKRRDIYLADAESGQTRLVLEIKDDKFLDIDYDLWVDDGKIVLSDWNDGHKHLYLYSYDQKHPGEATATLERQLTGGDFEVGDVYSVDFAGKRIEYASNEGNPLDQQLWQVGFDGQRRRLSAGAGFHAGNFAPVGTAFVDQQSSRMEPPTLRLCAQAGKCTVFWQTHAIEPYKLRAPEPLEVKAKDGETLYATLLLPAGATAARSVPLIVNPYGGPGSQLVVNRWSDSLLFDEVLAEHGFAVLHADNRGMAGRGRIFAQAAWHNFGPVQLEDQLTVVDAALGAHPELDPKRMGWWGWSWGGTFTLYSMTHSDRFEAGVAVAPVTDWRNYDSIYTERYMSRPEDFEQGYKEFSVVNAAANLKGRLLLVHGTGDDNVHIGNTVQFVQALIEAGKSYDLQIYPRKTHSIAGPDVRTHLFNRILAQFEQTLKP